MKWQDNFELQKSHPDLTVREYFEKKKAKLIAEREQEKKERLDDIRRKAEDLDLI